MSRERDVRQAVVDLLAATGEFHDVTLGDSDPRGRAASDLRLATVDPSSTSSDDQWDGGPDGGSVLDCRILVTVYVRAADPKLRDDAAERLLNVVRNAVNHQSLGDLTLPDFTKIKTWTWRPAQGGERSIVCVLSVRYIEEGWTSADAAE